MKDVMSGNVDARVNAGDVVARVNAGDVVARVDAGDVVARVNAGDIVARVVAEHFCVAPQITDLQNVDKITQNVDLAPC
jgi:hypothetical protein